MRRGAPWAVALAFAFLFAPLTLAETADMSGAPQVNDNFAHKSTGTDPSTLEREASSMNAQANRVRDGAEQYVFQAEVNRLMDIIINSLYSNKDIFLRELISNGSDALDKIRFMSLTDKAVLGEGETAKLDIGISLDKERNIISIRDRGIGMTKDDLIKNLGTIAKSGTSGFLEQMQKGGDVNLIGQFGVGFYSVYLVADYVEVITKHNDDKQLVWQSTADGHFSIAEDTGESIGRGTVINLHLKPEALEYADETKLRDLVHKYSEFIHFPIYILTEKEVEVPDEEAEEEQPEQKEQDEDEVTDDEDEAEAEDAGKKTHKEKRIIWDLLNDNQAIWLRKPQDVTEDEYKKFYRAVTQETGNPLGWVHFRGEGDVEFKSVLFVPSAPPDDFYEKYYEKGAKESLKLYVRRVFITDETGDDLLPRWLGFLRGLVDSDTLPLNVSREMMQQITALKTIKKKLVRKALDLFKKWSDDEARCQAAERGESTKNEDEEEDDEPAPTGEACKIFGKFWTQFGRAMKLGIIEDSTNRNRMAKLLRFHTSKSPNKLVSLDDYVSRMKEGQKDIYYLAGSTKEEIAKSPFVEQLLRKGYEVIYMTDVLDEYVMQHIPDYEDKRFSNASKEDLKMADKDEEEKQRDKELKEDFRGLTKWWKKLLGGTVTSVKVSTRLSTTPCVVVAGKYGQSANMERIMRAQALSDPSRAGMMKSQKVLEINPRHPLIEGLKDRVENAEEDDEEVQSMGQLLFDAALLESGFTPEDPKSFTSRVQDLVGRSLGVDPNATVDLEEDNESADAGSQEEAGDGQQEGAKDEL